MKKYDVLGYRLGFKSGTVTIPDDAIPLNLEHVDPNTILVQCLVPVKEAGKEKENDHIPPVPD